MDPLELLPKEVVENIVIWLRESDWARVKLLNKNWHRFTRQHVKKSHNELVCATDYSWDCVAVPGISGNLHSNPMAYSPFSNCIYSYGTSIGQGGVDSWNMNVFDTHIGLWQRQPLPWVPTGSRPEKGSKPSYWKDGKLVFFGGQHGGRMAALQSNVAAAHIYHENAEGDRWEAIVAGPLDQAAPTLQVHAQIIVQDHLVLMSGYKRGEPPSPNQDVYLLRLERNPCWRKPVIAGTPPDSSILSTFIPLKPGQLLLIGGQNGAVTDARQSHKLAHILHYSLDDLEFQWRWEQCPLSGLPITTVMNIDWAKDRDEKLRIFAIGFSTRLQRSEIIDDHYSEIQKLLFSIADEAMTEISALLYEWKDRIDDYESKRGGEERIAPVDMEMFDLHRVILRRHDLALEIQGLQRMLYKVHYAANQPDDRRVDIAGVATSAPLMIKFLRPEQDTTLEPADRMDVLETIMARARLRVLRFYEPHLLPSHQNPAAGLFRVGQRRYVLYTADLTCSDDAITKIDFEEHREWYGACPKLSQKPAVIAGNGQLFVDPGVGRGSYTLTPKIPYKP